MDEKGRFELDREVLRKHYAALAANECESVRFLLKSAKRWGQTGPVLELEGSRLKLKIEFSDDSPIPQRLCVDPSYRLAAIFPSSHCLYELAVGYNGLAYSETTRELSLTLLENTVVIDWHFEPDAELESALCSTFFRFGCGGIAPDEWPDLLRLGGMKSRANRFTYRADFLSCSACLRPTG